MDTQIFLERAAAMPAGPAAEQWEALARRAGRVTATREAGVTAMQVYAALKAMIEEAGLTAVAVGCYPHLMGKVCLPVSLLADDGVPVACEGDVNGALGMIILTS